MSIRCLLLALVAFLGLGFFAPPGRASESATTWNEAVESLAAAAVPPAGIRLRTLAISNIREGQTLARWPLSDHLERELGAAISRQATGFAVLGHERPDVPPTAADAGHDAVLSGTYRAASDGAFRLDLQVQDLRTRATLYRLEPVVLAAAAVPPGSLPATAFGKIVLDVEPAGAQVFVDGEPAGRGSQAIPVPAGMRLVTVAAEGYEVFDESVEVQGNGVVAVTVRLRRPSVTVTIEASVAGATVAIDGEERGITPLSVGGLAAGKHRVRVTKDGYRAYEAELDWTGGKTQVLRAHLPPIPGSLVVTADVGDARVEVDGAEAGRAPALVADLAPGGHKVRVTAGDRPAFEDTIEIRGGRTAHLRARLGSEAGLDFAGHHALAIVPRSRHPEDVALAAAVAGHLGPVVDLADPGLTVRQAQALFPEEQAATDPAGIRRLAQAVRAGRVAVVGSGQYEPFSRILGIWPQRPSLAADILVFQGAGPLGSEYSRVVHDGGEPWLGSPGTPDRQALAGALAADVAAHLSGRRTGRIAPDARHALPNTASLYLGDGRAGLGAGLLYERRVLEWLELGAGYAYSNALGNDFRSGTRLSFAGLSGNDLIYGIGHNHELRADALVRPDGPAPRAGAWFDGPRWAPYLGVGARLNIPLYLVFGVNRKEPERGYFAYEPKGSALAGVKATFGGLVLRAELEFPVVMVREEVAAPHLLLGGGWVF